MQKRLIISPHSDDALFSASHLLFDKEHYEVSVLTVENDPIRIKEDENLFEILEIPFYHLDLEFIDNSYQAYWKTNKEVTKDKAIQFLDSYFGKDTIRLKTKTN